MRRFRFAAATTVTVLAIPLLAATASATGSNGTAQTEVTKVAAALGMSSAHAQKAHDLVIPESVSITPNSAGAVATDSLTFFTDWVTEVGDVVTIGYEGSVLPTVSSDYAFDGVPVTSAIFQDPDVADYTSISSFIAPVTGNLSGPDTVSIAGVINPAVAGTYAGAVVTERESGDATAFPYTIAAAPAPVVIPDPAPIVTVTPPTPAVAPSIKLNHTKAIYGTKVTATISHLKPGTFVTLVQSGGGHSYGKGTGRANSEGVSKVIFTPSSNVNFTYKMTAAGTDTNGAAKKASTSLKVLKKAAKK